MAWFENEGRSPQFAIYSQTSYKRNAAGLPFPKHCAPAELCALTDRIDKLLSNNGFWRESVPDGDSAQLNALAEKGYIDRDMLSPTDKRAIYFNEPCSLAVSVGGKDLITVRSLLAGAAIADSRNIASGAEELLDREIEFAYSDALGYVASSPALCGSGVEFSALLFLPSLSLTDEAEDDLRLQLARLGAVIYPTFSASGNPGDTYIVSHSPSHLSREAAAAEGFDRIIAALITRESDKLRYVNHKEAVGSALEAYGAIKYAEALSEVSLLRHLSRLRLGLICSGGKLQKLPHLSYTALNTSLGRCLSASVITECGACATEEECNAHRARLASSILSAGEA